RRDALGAPGDDRAGALRRDPLLHRDERGARGRAAGDAPGHPGSLPRRDVRGLRTALPALHRAGVQGWPEHGVFLQITCDDAADLAVPGQAYTFGVVKAAQARGDVQVLVERVRRALRIHLDTDVRRGLQTLRSAVERAIG